MRRILLAIQLIGFIVLVCLALAVGMFAAALPFLIALSIARYWGWL